MASLKAALAVMIVLAVGAGAASWSTSHALAMVEPGVELALRWRMALAFANWFVRLEPWLAIFGVGAAALVGAAVSRGTTIPQERRLLLGWLLIAFVSLVFDVLFLATWTTLTNPWISMLALSAGFGVVALVASVVVAGHLQSRLRASGSRINGWHVIAASAVLVLLGPAALVPPIAVWLYSGRLLGPVRGSPS